MTLRGILEAMATAFYIFSDYCLIYTHRNQSTTRIKVTSSIGNPTAARTITMVTRPACGTPAAPMEAAVAVILLTRVQTFQALPFLISTGTFIHYRWKLVLIFLFQSERH